MTTQQQNKAAMPALLSETLMVSLEPRILMDAAGFITAAEILSDTDNAYTPPDHSPETASSDALLAATADEVALNPARQELIVLDANAERDFVITALQADGAYDPNTYVQVLRLDANHSGLGQISAALDLGDYDAVRIFAATDNNTLSLGNEQIAVTDLDRYAGQIHTLHSNLDADTEVKVYGYQSGQTSFIKDLSAPTLQPEIAATAPVDALATRLEYVFVDAGLENYQSLIDAYQANSGVELRLVIIDSNENGLDKITATLQSYADSNTKLDAIHILSHAEEANLMLGNVYADLKTLNLPEVSAQISQTWAAALNPGADILLYGCNVAAGQTGIAFVERLGELANADVAASSDVTGAGGNWILEYQSGPIETAALSLESYLHSLGFATTDFNGDGLANPLRMITWNVIGVDSNKPATEGPDTFMVGLRVNADANGLSGYTVKIVDDDARGIDIFGTGFSVGDAVGDYADGVDNIQFINRMEYTNVDIAPNSYRDFYFNVQVDRSKLAHNQIQPFHFEVFKDDNNDGIWNGAVINPDNTIVKGAGGEDGAALTHFSWLPLQDGAGNPVPSNTPLYLYVEKYISQARNAVENQTATDGSPAIRVETDGGFKNLLIIFLEARIKKPY
jgi:hypothetical protein